MPRAILRLQPGEQVAIRVRGISGALRGPWNDITTITAMADPTAPNPPTNLTAEAGYRALYCRWANSLDDRDLKFCFFYLDTSPIPLDGMGRVNISGLSSNARIHAVDADCLYVSGLAPGTTYYARVEAVDTAGNRSQASGQVSGTTTDSPWDDWYLRLDCANGPLTSDLALNGHLVFDGGNRAVVADEGYNLRLKLGDNAGGTRLDIQQLSNTVVANIDSAGKASFAGVDAGGERITSVGTPTGSSDAATKGYVDAHTHALDDLEDVAASSPEDGQVLIYDGTAEVWQAADLPGPTPQGPIADVKDDYATGDLDTEAEVIVAVNEIASAANDILAVLRAHGLIET